MRWVEHSSELEADGRIALNGSDGNKFGWCGLNYISFCTHYV